MFDIDNNNKEKPLFKLIGGDKSQGSYDIDTTNIIYCVCQVFLIWEFSKYTEGKWWIL